MSYIIEVDDEGRLILPREILGDMKPHTQYRVDVENNAVTAVPVTGEQIRSKEDAEKWVKLFLDWVNEPKPSVPHLPNEALRRENIYD